MTNDEMILVLVEPRKKKLGLYIFLIYSFLIICGLISLSFNILSFEVTLLIFFGITFISIPPLIGINHNLKNFKLSNDKIILQKDRLLKQIDNQSTEKSIIGIKKIILKYSGFDEGPFSPPFFNRNPIMGNQNFMEIYYIDDTKDSYEFYIKTERESIVLKNILVSYRTSIEVEILKRNNSR